ncbi:MAG: hypothetical protein QXD62_03975 [Candidatus Woesearchaeota archaeon]
MKLNNKAQSEHIDEMMALLIFLLFIFLTVSVIVYLLRSEPFLTINQDFIKGVYNSLKEEIEINYWFVYAPQALGYDIIKLPVKNKTFTTDFPFYKENDTIYLLADISERNIIELIYLPSELEPKSKPFQSTFSCIDNICRLFQSNLIFIFNRNLLKELNFQGFPLIKDSIFYQDRAILFIQNTTTENKKLFHTYRAHNLLISIDSIIKNNNNKLTIELNKIQKNVPYTDIEIEFLLANFERFTSSKYLNYEIDYERSKLLNQTICLSDYSKYIVFPVNYTNTSNILIFASVDEFNLTLCFDENENLKLRILFRVNDTKTLTINLQNSTYDFNMDTHRYKIVEGMPIKRQVLSEKKAEQFFRNPTMMLEYRDVIISDEFGKILYSLGKETLRNVKVETYMEKMLLDKQDFSIIPVYVSFLEWTE